jgi:hypothetical protein
MRMVRLGQFSPATFLIVLVEHDLDFLFSEEPAARACRVCINREESMILITVRILFSFLCNWKFVILFIGSVFVALAILV